MLKTMCIFQSSVVFKLRKLSKYPSAFQHLWDYASFYEPLLKNFEKNEQFIVLSKLFNSRLDDIILWIDHCKSLSMAKRWIPKVKAVDSMGLKQNIKFGMWKWANITLTIPPRAGCVAMSTVCQLGFFFFIFGYL